MANPNALEVQRCDIVSIPENQDLTLLESLRLWLPKHIGDAKNDNVTILLVQCETLYFLIDIVENSLLYLESIHDVGRDYCDSITHDIKQLLESGDYHALQ